MSEGPGPESHRVRKGESRNSNKEFGIQGLGREAVWLTWIIQIKHSEKMVFVSDSENCVGGKNLDLHISCFSFLQLLITSYLVLGKSEISSNLLAPGLPISPSRKSVCSPFHAHCPHI